MILHLLDIIINEIHISKSELVIERIYFLLEYKLHEIAAL